MYNVITDLIFRPTYNSLILKTNSSYSLENINGHFFPVAVFPVTWKLYFCVTCGNLSTIWKELHNFSSPSII
jgi:hypothetical protein